MYATIVGGEIEGPRLRASLAAPGIDWMGTSGDGYFRPDVHVAFRTPTARPREDGPELYKTFRDKKDGCIKVVMKP
jgi:hypothetical protein